MRQSKLERRVTPTALSPAVTLEMVARSAGVSPSTVSRILNGTARVSEEKVNAVQAAIADLHFLPNPVARSLARGRSMSIGIVTQAIDSPFYGEALAAIETALVRAEYSSLFVSGHWNEDDERRCIDRLLSRRVEGIIIVTSCLPASFLVNLSQQVPLVLTGREVRAPRICSLSIDSRESARLGTDYLLDLGHRKIAFLAGPAGRIDGEQRLEGYESALRARKIAVQRKLVVRANYSAEGGSAATEALLKAGADFTAIVAANDQSAYGSMLTLYRHKIRVPDDVSVIGFDDLPTSAFTIPPLTSVKSFVRVIGIKAAAAIIELIEGREPNAALPTPMLSIRESAAPCGA